MAATIAALSPIKLSSVSRGKKISGRGRAAALLWPSIKIQTASRRGFFAPSGGSRSKGESVILLRRHCGPSEGFILCAFCCGSWGIFRFYHCVGFSVGKMQLSGVFLVEIFMCGINQNLFF